jgi:hypothetical protein
LNALTLLAELFIGIAGFSGIVVALSGSSVASDPLDRFRVVSLLVIALGGAVFAAAPLVLADAGASPRLSWLIASGAYSVYLALNAAWLVRRRSTLPQAALDSLHPVVWILVLGGSSIFAAALLANAIGWPFSNPAVVYLYSLLYALLVSCIQFVRLLLVRPGNSPAA